MSRSSAESAAGSEQSANGLGEPLNIASFFESLDLKSLKPPILVITVIWSWGWGGREAEVVKVV